MVALAGGGLFVTNQSDDSVTWFDADRITQMTWSSAPAPHAIAVAADGARAYVVMAASKRTTQ